MQSSEGGFVDNQVSFTLEAEGGTEIFLNASAKEGWSFDQWFGLGSEVLSQDNLNFVLNSNLDIEANFKINSYSLDIGTSEFGQVSGKGNYEFGSTVEIIAAPNEGYVFEKWEGDIEYIVSTLEPQTFVNIPSRDIEIIPIFKIIPISVNVNIVGEGSVSGAGSYSPNTPFTLEATGNPSSPSAPRGYDILHWKWTDETGNLLSSTQNPLTISANDDILIEAEFFAIPPDETELNLVSLPTNGGIIFDDPEYRHWNIDNDTIDRNVTAQPQHGYYFKGWSITPDSNFSISWKSPSVILSPVADSNLTAHFGRIKNNLNVFFDESMGTTSNFQKKYFHSESFNLKAIPHPHYQFDSWSVLKEEELEVSLDYSDVRKNSQVFFINGEESPKLYLYRGFTYKFITDLDNGHDFYLSTNLDEETPYSSEFLIGVENSRSQNGTLILNVSSSTPDRLYYKSSKEKSTFGIIDILDFETNKILPFPDQAEISSKIGSNLSLFASFEPIEYDIKVEAGNGGSVKNVSGKFLHTDEVNLVAYPNDHFEFVRWEGSNEIADSESPNTTLSVSKSTEIKAVFAPTLYTLTLKSEPEGTASFITPDNKFSFPFGTEVEIQALPLTGYKFMSWNGSIKFIFKINFDNNQR